MSTVVEVASDMSPVSSCAGALTTLQRTKKEEETPWGCDCLPSASPYQRCQGWQKDIYTICREHAFIAWLQYQGNTQPDTSHVVSVFNMEARPGTRTDLFFWKQPTP
ncbi:uncharacterized protein LOC144100209 [Amblyomma americanum]